MNLRKLIDFLSCVILLLCICVLPIYILITFQTNKNIIRNVEEINRLFLHLEKSHKMNAEILFDSLEFRRLEYKCYFSTETNIFEKAFLITLKNYGNYLSNDKSLSSEEKKTYMNHIYIMEKAFEGRKELLHKLLQYDIKRKYYLNQISSKISEQIEINHKETCLNHDENISVSKEELNEVLTPVEPVKKILNNPIPVTKNPN